MSAVAPHEHPIAPGEWPFAEAENTAVFTTSRALRDGEPILLVTHNQNGDWQFLCGAVDDRDECLVVCFACAYVRDKSVGKLSDLPRGWQAARATVNSPWDRYEVEDDDE